VRLLLIPVTLALLGVARTTASTADVVKPTIAGVIAYRQGQAYERLFEDIDLGPGTCGIVLERARCSSDLELISALRGQDPTDALALKWFASGDFGLRVRNWNGMYVPDKAWTENPVFAWWYTAGVVSIAASLPQGGPLGDYLAHYTDELAEHSSAAPDNSAKWVPSGYTPIARAASLQANLEAIVPVAPYPEPSFADGTSAYAQLGVYVSTLQQLVDNPTALSRPESRAFAAAVFASYKERTQSSPTG
jgi:hypothetical protein